MLMQNKRAVSAWQMTCSQRLPMRFMKNFPMKAEGSSVRPMAAKLTNWLPGRFSVLSCPPM